MHTCRPVHLNGSLTLNSERDVFRLVSDTVGPAIARIPDGETGDRGQWIGWQAAHLFANPALEPANAGALGDVGKYQKRSKLVLKPGRSIGELAFDNLGYAEEAARSYAIFVEMREKGEIPAGKRFQVSLPTPLAVLTAFFESEAQEEIEPVLEAGFIAELNHILADIPHEDLAIQWDVAVEFGIMEANFPTFLTDKKNAIIARLVRLGQAVPADVELGYHLCYGNLGLKHFVEPKDTALLVEIANAILDGVGRPVEWIHMPVPVERDDDAYFAPLANLKRPETTQYFLGLIHLQDGAEGANRRIAAASRYLDDFGIGSECGLSNRTPDYTEQTLALYREVSGC